MTDIVTLIASTLAPAGAPQAGDKTLIVRGASLFASAPLKPLGGSIGASPLVLDMVANGITGSFALGLYPAAGTTIRVEFSRDGGLTYSTAGDYSAEQAIQYTKRPTDANYVTHLRLTRVAGSSTASTYDVANGVVAITGAQLAMIGVFRRKAIVVDGTTRIANVDPVEDRGYILESYGVDQNILLIRSDLTGGGAWDRSLGAVGFMVERCSLGAVFVNPAADLATFTGSLSGTTLTVSAKSAGTLAPQQILNCANVLERMRIVSQLSGTTGGVGTYQVNQSQTLASQAMTTGVAIYNKRAFELIQNGEALLYKSNEPDVWVVQ